MGLQRAKIALGLVLIALCAGMFSVGSGAHSRAIPPSPSDPTDAIKSSSAPDSMDMLLTVLKVAGLVIASLATIYGLTHETYVKDADNVRHPTQALKYSIAFAVAGLLISLNTTVLESISKRRAEDRAEQDKRQAELKAAQDKQREILEEASREQRQAVRELRAVQEIVLATQPLNSLKITWSFSHVPHQFTEIISREDIESADNKDRLEEYIGQLEPVTRAIERAMAWDRRQRLLYPWINVLATGKWNSSPSVMLLPLDSVASAVLPLGRLKKNDETKMASESIELEVKDEDIMTWQSDPPGHGRLILTGDRIEITWTFPLGELGRCINRNSSAPTIPAATFPDTIKVITLGSLERFPCKPKNFSERLVRFPDSGQIDKKGDAFLMHSVLELERNDIPGSTVRYAMTFLGRSPVDEEVAVQYEGIFWPTTVHYCIAGIWEGKRKIAYPVTDR